jgi:hypothetical protein
MVPCHRVSPGCPCPTPACGDRAGSGGHRADPRRVPRGPPRHPALTTRHLRVGAHQRRGDGQGWARRSVGAGDVTAGIRGIGAARCLAAHRGRRSTLGDHRHRLHHQSALRDLQRGPAAVLRRSAAATKSRPGLLHDRLHLRAVHAIRSGGLAAGPASPRVVRRHVRHQLGHLAAVGDRRHRRCELRACQLGAGVHGHARAGGAHRSHPEGEPRRDWRRNRSRRGADAAFLALWTGSVRRQ